MEISDQEIKNLVKQSQKGDRQAFTGIYRLFFDKIFKYVFFRARNREEAEDLTALVFLKAWQNLGRYKIKKTAKFSTWLFQIARFTLIDYYRKKPKEISLECADQPIVREDFDQKMELDEIKKQMLCLHEKCRTVIALRYFEDLSLQEIAEIMGMTSVGTRVLLHRSLAKLKNLTLNHEK